MRWRKTTNDQTDVPGNNALHKESQSTEINIMDTEDSFDLSDEEFKATVRKTLKDLRKKAEKKKNDIQNTINKLRMTMKL